MEEWFRLNSQQVLEKLSTSKESGLSGEEARRRLEQYGSNELVDRGAKSPWKILLEQFTGIMIIILIISAVISIFLHEYADAIAILIIVFLNAILGFTQEYRAEKAMEALKDMAVPRVHVRRDGRVQEIEAKHLVPGDIVVLEAGNRIPADGRLVESQNLRIQEAVLTGESEPVEKNVDALQGEHVALGDQKNSAFMGTAATYGRGTLVITETGMKTQLGRIADMIQNVGAEETPLQRRLEQLGKGLAVAALIIVAIVFGLGLWRGEDLRLMFMTGISMAVAAVPEGLPAVVTIALALGAQRMLRRNALIRKLPAVETLGSVTVICSDKTGTLTENRMTVTVVDVAGKSIDVLERVHSYAPEISLRDKPIPEVANEPSVLMLLMSGALCNDAYLEEKPEEKGGYAAVGDPTEGALVVAAAQAGLWKERLESALPRVDEVPFDSDRKRMTTVHAIRAGDVPDAVQGVLAQVPGAMDGRRIAFTKGAVDGLLDVSVQVLDQGRLQPMTPEWKQRILDSNAGMAKNGMRVLGAAFRLLPESGAPLSELDERELVFVGMFGMIDPARPEVRDAVSVAQGAGIRPVMITGDHPLTALSIARDLGIARDNTVLTGKELETMSVEELQKQVENVQVFARVSPEHKLKIVEALQNLGHNVAMTGDGVNDAPALKKADIGVAMGITGTDVSKEAADMVLLDDNFATIVAAVEEGRRIYDNIRKFIKYALASNSGEILVMLIAPFLGMPLPLTPLQILWVNLVTDGLPGLALTVEAAEPSTMRRKPHAPNENIFARGLGRDVLLIGFVLALLSLLAGYIFWRNGSENWQTIVFTTLTLAQMGNVMALRADHESVFQIGFFSNRYMIGAVLLTVALQLLVIYVPLLQNLFGTRPLSLSELGISFALSLLLFIFVEVMKWVRRMGENK